MRSYQIGGQPKSTQQCPYKRRERTETQKEGTHVMTETGVTHAAPSKPQKLGEEQGADSPSETPEGINADAMISEFWSPKPVRQ